MPIEFNWSIQFSVFPITGSYAATTFPQCACLSSLTSLALPPSITTSPLGCLIRNHGTGISKSSFD